jgi:hypothetical protein
MRNLFVDYRIMEEELFNLGRLGFNVIRCPRCELLYDAVDGHPDMLLHVTGEKSLVAHRDMDMDFLSYLSLIGYQVTLSEGGLKKSYPEDVILNAVSLPSVFIHNLSCTDGSLMSAAGRKALIDVKQGYTKCSCAVVSGNALMTSDVSIARALEASDVDVLLLPPGDIELPGLDYGFIGGTCGLIDESRMAFYGDLAFYPHGKEVLSFLQKHGVDPVFLRRGKLADRGSILGFSFKEEIS